MKKKYYIGCEAEGMHKGELTLFIASDEASVETLKNYLKEHPEIKRIYFGAQGTYGIPPKYIALAAWLTEDVGIIVEVNDPNQLEDIVFLLDRKNLRIVYSIPVYHSNEFLKNLDNLCMDVKLDGPEGVIVFVNFAEHFTSLNDLCYELDKEIFF